MLYQLQLPLNPLHHATQSHHHTIQQTRHNTAHLIQSRCVTWCNHCSSYYSDLWFAFVFSSSYRWFALLSIFESLFNLKYNLIHISNSQNPACCFLNANNILRPIEQVVELYLVVMVIVVLDCMQYHHCCVIFPLFDHQHTLLWSVRFPVCCVLRIGHNWCATRCLHKIYPIRDKFIPWKATLWVR